jgi:hypothetical protein
MNPIPNRIVIYPKDVMNITGRRERAARLLLTRIRKKLRKKRSEFITLEDFCGYTGLKPEHVTNFLT